MGSTQKVALEQAGSVVLIPLALVDESPSNTRKTFHEQKLLELASSIRIHGVQQPVTVRAVGSRFELVFGHRRFRASRLAELAAIPAQVRELTDSEVRELQLVENGQRDDVDPLEEADGYRELVEKFAYTVDDLASKTGKSKGFILGRLALCHLCPEARKAYASGRLALYGAVAIARIPDAAIQAEATKELTRYADPLGPRQVREVIEQRFMLLLKDAPFPIGDATLIPAAGSCNACPKRTGNQPELFSDASRKDLCTDSACFALKKEAGWTQKLEAALAKGHEVLDDEACAQLYPYAHGGLVYGSEYVDLAEKCHQDSKFRTWGALLGSTKPPIYLARDKAGRAHQLVRLEDAKALLKQSNVPAVQAVVRQASLGGNDSHRAAEKRARKAHELRRKTVVRGMDEIVTAALKRKPDEAMWRFIAGGFLRGSWSEVVRDVARRRGLLTAKGASPSEVLEKAMKAMGAAELAALVIECLAWRFASSPHGGGYGTAFTEACDVFGVDVKALEKEVAKDVKAPKAKAGKKPTAADDTDDDGEDLGDDDDAQADAA